MLVYSDAQYIFDFCTYQNATHANPLIPAVALQARNNLITGVKNDIDFLYGKQFNQLFGRENGLQVTGDALTLGFGAAGSIATHVATKTIFAALGTAFSGLNLSISKNYYGQQAFQVIGTAMETRRQRLADAMLSKLANTDVSTYTLNQALDDLTLYMNAGTLPAGLTELQQEAAAAGAVAKANQAVSIPSPPTNVQAAGALKSNALGWSNSAGASSYTVYMSDSSPVTTASIKVSGLSSPVYLDKNLADGKLRYYAVSATNTSGESKMSAEVQATTLASNVAANPLAAPVLAVISEDSQLALIWQGSPGAASYQLIWSTHPDMSAPAGTLILTETAHVISGLANGTPYYVSVEADAAGVGPGRSKTISVIPNKPPS